MIHIAFLNESTTAPDADVLRYAQAIQHQVAYDVGPAWSLPRVSVVFVPKGRTVPKDYWQMVVLDTSDQAGALGYHDLTADGKPLGKAFAATDKEYGLNLSVTLSHEVLEMLGDPDINLWAMDYRDGWMHAYELCDAVESDTDGYIGVNGVALSNFVTPYFFTPQAADIPGAKFDHLGQLTQPFETRPNGYQSVIKLSSSDKVSQLERVGAPDAAPGARPGGGTRADRRLRRTEGGLLEPSRKR